MAILLFAGYLFLIIWNLKHGSRREKMSLGWLLAIGILVQFGWESFLLLCGLRSAGLNPVQAIRPPLIDSLMETNFGTPYIYCIYLWYSYRFTQELKRRSTLSPSWKPCRETTIKKCNSCPSGNK